MGSTPVKDRRTIYMINNFLNLIVSNKINSQNLSVDYQKFLYTFQEEMVFCLISMGVFILWLLVRDLVLQYVRPDSNMFAHFNVSTLIKGVVSTLFFLIIGISPYILLYSMDDAELDTSCSFTIEHHPCFLYSRFLKSTHIISKDENLNLDSSEVVKNDLTYGRLKPFVLDNWVVLCKGSLTYNNKIGIPSSDHLNQKGVYYPIGNKINGVNTILVPVEKIATQPNRGIESESERWLAACESHLEKKRINKQKELELHEETIAIKTFLTAFYVVTGIRRLAYVISLIIKAINEG